MLTVLSVFGTRPEAIKMAPVVRELEKYSDQIKSVVCVTGQHREQLDQVLNIFSLTADYDLKLMTKGQTLPELTGKLFPSLDKIYETVNPDWILAQGDTTTVMVAAQAAYYRKIKFGHIEAGLRTDDPYQPFPEEINRRIADCIAERMWPPTERGKEALLRENVSADKISVTGNTVIDTLLMVAEMDFDWKKSALAKIDQHSRKVLVTAHRRENFGKPFAEICSAIRALAEEYISDDVQFIYPVHLNPKVREPVNKILRGIENVHLIEPLDYLSLIHLMKSCELVLTDSGGIQEEAPSLGVPVLVMRNKTERPEGVEAGVVKLVGTEKNSIITNASQLLSNSSEREKMSKQANPYGDGHASERIVADLLREI